MSDDDSVMATAAALFDAIERKDVDAVARLYADDVAVWHNFDDATQDKAANLAVLAGLCKHVPAIRYEIVERHALGGGRTVQRHVLRARTAGGAEIAIPACIFVSVADGRITRVDEYLDTAQANRLRSATGRPPVGE